MCLDTSCKAFYRLNTGTKVDHAFIFQPRNPSSPSLSSPTTPRHAKTASVTSPPPWFARSRRFRNYQLNGAISATLEPRLGSTCCMKMKMNLCDSTKQRKLDFWFLWRTRSRWGWIKLLPLIRPWNPKRLKTGIFRNICYSFCCDVLSVWRLRILQKFDSIFCPAAKFIWYVTSKESGRGSKLMAQQGILHHTLQFSKRKT